jgi:transglutaminase-like putative cysteine protease
MLGIACAALGHAIVPIFPEVGVFAGVSIVSLVIISRLESRVRLLAIPDANLLGGGIALSVALWAGYRIIREVRTGESAELGWTLFGVALMAPLLMAAMPAKLLRREKHAGDYWQLYAAALGAIVLAAAVDETPVTFIAMVVYIGCTVWNLIEFHTAQADGTIPPIPAREGKNAGAEPAPRGTTIRAVPVGRSGRPGIVRALALTAVAAVLATPLYLVMPRSTFGKQEFGKPRIEIGYEADQMINLNRDGKLETNREVAFIVEARANDRPKTDLDPNQRWRGKTLVEYRQGTWQQDPHVSYPRVEHTARRSLTWSPPNFGPGQFELRFAVPADLRTEFLADPVVWRPGEPIPIAAMVPGGFQPWYVLPNGSIVPQPGLKAIDATRRYVQHYVPLADPDLGPGFTRVDPSHEWEDKEFFDCPVDAVRKYADETVKRLVEKKKLPAAVLDRGRIHLTRVLPEHHEVVARAFEEYLSNDAGLTYTTNLRRVNRDVDPIEDFLLYSRSGHCERFASALVLMLRSQGIPAAAVLGFKGCEHVGNGRYEIRQEHAHVWVEALISRPDGQGGRVWHWLSLDPSPRDEAADPAAGGSGGMLGRMSTWGRDKLDRYLIRYSPEERKRALTAVTGFLAGPAFLSATGFLAALGLIVFAVRRRRHRKQPAIAARESAWLDRLLGVLAAGGFVPVPGQTPREFAAAVANDLELRPQTAPVAAVPSEWVETYYRLRFGGTPPSEVAQARLDLRLEELREALTGS